MIFLVALLFKKELSQWDPYKIGLLLGLSFLFRYQVGFMIFGLVLWMAFRLKSKFKVFYKMGIA